MCSQSQYLEMSRQTGGNVAVVFHPNLYHRLEWWSMVCRVEPRIIKSELNDNYATVNVRSKLYLNSGKVINAVV